MRGLFALAICCFGAPSAALTAKRMADSRLNVLMIVARPPLRRQVNQHAGASLPQALIGAGSGHGRAVGMGELQELEDQGELNPLIRAAVEQYATEMG